MADDIEVGRVDDFRAGAFTLVEIKGREYFDRVPLFDYDIGGIEFSIFYEDRARNLWGTPTAFLYKMV